MATQYPELNDKLIAFIQEQALFFVGTADRDGRVNVSPKGLDSLRVLSPRKVLWLNLTGSGNESAAHVRAVPRMTLMFCSFGKQPLILRLYGQARVVHPSDADWPELSAHFPALPGARQVFELDIDLVQTSCGFAVPYFEFKGERPTLNTWAEKRGPEGLREYWKERNALSLDGKPTGILDGI
jgi:Pyridoxamine 5''-phosphate oxidase.